MIIYLMISLLIFAFIIPNANGYGTTFESAQKIKAAIYSETLSWADYEAYYKVRCIVNTTLSVIINFTGGTGFDLSLSLHDPDLMEFTRSGRDMMDIMDNCWVTCNESGSYYIKVWRCIGLVSADFTLNITLINGSIIPGFEIIYILIGFGIFIEIFIYIKINKEKKMN